MFRSTETGHAIKSRALVTEVTGCEIADGPAGTGSYLIEAPNGGAVRITGNLLERGPGEGNNIAIAIGREGDLQPTPSIVISNNRFVNKSGRQQIFLDNRTPTAATESENTLEAGRD